MKPIIYSVVALSLSAAPAYAAHEGHEHNHPAAPETSDTAKGVEGAACADTVRVKVNGLVCDFCARALEKVFSRRDGVAGINVDLDKSEVVVAMRPGKTLDDATLTGLITDAGYNVSHIQRGC